MEDWPESNREEAIGALIADVDAHLRWRLAAGLGRVPPPAAFVTPAPARGESSAAPPAPVRPPESAETPVQDSGPLGWQKGLGSDALTAIRQDLGDCTRCKLCEGRTNLVFGVGNPHAEVVFVGEGPGAREDERGEPFVGPAGQLLTKMIVAMGYERDEVYICNVVKCRPPGNRDPEPGEVAACEPFLKAQLAAIEPKVIVGLGRFAVQCLLGDPNARITRVRGQWADYEGIALMPTFHPAYLLRNASAKRDAWADLKSVLSRLGKSP